MSVLVQFLAVCHRTYFQNRQAPDGEKDTNCALRTCVLLTTLANRRFGTSDVPGRKKPVQLERDYSIGTQQVKRCP
jgi:hypothetical protein